jgi:membrane protein YdbS with pleckstrin-like domain
MAYPQKLLADNEKVEFDLRPHWSSISIPIVWLILIVGVGGFLYGKLGTWFDTNSSVLSVLRWAVIIIGIFLFIFLVYRPVIAWFTTQYVFTNRRLIVRTGLIARRGRDMPLSKVNNVIFDHTIIQRILNCGTLTIESAAENGSLVVSYVPNVEHVQREVYRLHDEDDAFRAARSEMYENQFRHGDVPEVLADFGVPGTAQPDQQPAPGQPSTGTAPTQRIPQAPQPQAPQPQQPQPQAPQPTTRVTPPAAPPSGPPAAPPSSGSGNW